MLARPAYQTDADELAAACFPGKALMACTAPRAGSSASCPADRQRHGEGNISFTTALQKQTLRDIKCGEISRSYGSKGSFFLFFFGNMLEFSENNEAFQRTRQQL